MVSLHCPACRTALTVDLPSLARAGSTTCSGCRRRLNMSQVSNAIDRTRRHVNAQAAAAAPPP